MKNEVFMIDPKLIKINPKFAAQFKIKENNLDALTEDMIKNGFDRNNPVILWTKTDEIIDGMTRRKASIAAGLSRIYAVYKDFENESDVIAWMEHNQYSRRNHSLEDMVKKIAENMDEYKAQTQKQYYLIAKFKIKARQATTIMSILNNPAKLKAVISEGKSATATANSKTATIEQPIITACNKLLKLIDNELSESDIEALDGLRRAIGQIIRTAKKTA